MSSLLIKDGTLVNPIGRNGKLDILIEDDRISTIATKITYDADEVIDAFGRQIAPWPFDDNIDSSSEQDKENDTTSESIPINRATEISNIHRDVHLAIETGTEVNIKYVSTSEGVALIRWGKKNGGNIHAETTPYHFSFTSEDTETYNALRDINPPLRTERDRIAIVSALSDEIIEVVSTSFTLPNKPQSSIAKLEAALALGITELVKYKHVSLKQLITLMSASPTLTSRNGMSILAIGAIANIVIFDPYIRWGIHDDFPTFTNRQLYGKVKYAIKNGQITYRAKSFLG